MAQQPETEFDTKIECAWTLASRFYTDPAVLQEEKRKVFHRTWQLAGRTDRLQEPGSYFTADVHGEPIIVARDLEGRLRAFSNVCRHRAGPVAEGAGCRKTFQCGYHGWTYTLDGRLIGTPDVDGMEFFDRSEFGLVPLRLETWGSFAFVNFEISSPPLSTFLDEAWGFGDTVSAMALMEKRDYVIECNWKVYVDNHLEGYHIPIAHPGLMREIDYANYRTTARRYSSRQHAPMRNESTGNGERLYTSGEDALYLWVFPNLMLNFYPGNLQINLVLPISQERTLTIFEWYALQTDSAEVSERLRRSIEFSHQVQQEDIGLCEAVQRGLRSITYDRGRYSVRRENGVHHFHSLLHEFLARE
ncbi:MAG: Rieske 2Fe-2S domain-containing protein [Acidipila sp.]|nr:Rieske 2Fe-2S domain-containing protein [Acidipila sp.]